jgi:hypothetical protein
MAVNALEEAGGTQRLVAKAHLMRAKIATAHAACSPDLNVCVLADHISTRAAIAMHAVSTNEPWHHEIVVESGLNLVRGTLLLIDRTDATSVVSDWTDNWMSDARDTLRATQALAELTPLAHRPDIVLDLLLLGSWFNELLYRWDDTHVDALENAIVGSREAVKVAVDAELGFGVALGGLQLTRQLFLQPGDFTEASADECRHALATALINSVPLSAVCVSLLSLWARVIYTTGFEHTQPDLRAFGSAVWSVCCEHTHARDPELCWAIATDWSRHIALVDGPAEAAEAYVAAAAALRRVILEQSQGGLAGLLLARGGSLHSFAVTSLAAAGDTIRAAQIAEAGRLLGTQRLVTPPDDELQQLRTQGLGTLADAYCSAQAEVQRTAELADRVLGPDHRLPWDEAVALTDRIASGSRHFGAARAAIRDQPGFEDFPRAVELPALQEAAQDAPIAYIAAGSHGGGVVILDGTNEDAPRYIELPSLDNEAACSHGFGLRDAYDDWAKGGAKSGTWSQRLDDTAGWLWEAIMARLLDVVDGAPFVRLVPLGALSLMPLHLAWQSCGGCRQYAMDSTAFAYLPSVSQRLSAMRRPVSHEWSALLVEGPGLNSSASAMESHSAQHRFQTNMSLRGKEATASVVAHALTQCNMAHLSAHGSLNELSPFESAIGLEGDDILRIRDVLRLPLDHLELLVLSSCESAMSASLVPDGCYGFPGLLYGHCASAVVAAQWQVDQMATAKLFAAFYRHWDLSHEIADIAEALRRAQVDMRDHGPTDPIWWGGFTLTG